MCGDRILHYVRNDIERRLFTPHHAIEVAVLPEPVAGPPFVCKRLRCLNMHTNLMESLSSAAASNKPWKWSGMKQYAIPSKR